jgi:hypothetical protein
LLVSLGDQAQDSRAEETHDHRRCHNDEDEQCHSPIPEIARRPTIADLVATLCLLAMFSPGNLFWIAALLVAMTDIPDFTPFLQRITAAVRRIAQSPKMKEEVRSPAKSA